MAAHTRPAGRPRHRRRTAIGAASLVTPDLGLEHYRSGQHHYHTVIPFTKIFVFEASVAFRPALPSTWSERIAARLRCETTRPPVPPLTRLEPLSLPLHAPVRS